jgi:hypothetical protein
MFEVWLLLREKISWINNPNFNYKVNNNKSTNQHVETSRTNHHFSQQSSQQPPRGGNEGQPEKWAPGKLTDEYAVFLEAGESPAVADGMAGRHHIPWCKFSYTEKFPRNTGGQQSSIMFDVFLACRLGLNVWIKTRRRACKVRCERSRTQRQCRCLTVTTVRHLFSAIRPINLIVRCDLNCLSLKLFWLLTCSLFI